jgi:hypothetical protein
VKKVAVSCALEMIAPSAPLNGAHVVVS